MSENIAEQLVDFLARSGVKRIYGIVGDSLNPVTDALRRHGGIQWFHVRHEEAAAFAASAESQITGELAVCCGSSGPGNLHLINGLYDAQHTNTPVFAIASHLPLTQVGNDYFQATHPEYIFQECSEYAELISLPEQVMPLTYSAINHAVTKRGVGVIVLPGDVAGKTAESSPAKQYTPPAKVRSIPADNDLNQFADLIQSSKRITFFCGAGCAQAAPEIIELSKRIKAPVAYTFRGKEWIEHDNPNAIGMTGLLGWGDAYRAMHDCDLLIMWGTDFPYRNFLPSKPAIVQVDIRPENIGRRCKVDLGLCGDIKETILALLPLLQEKGDDSHLQTSLEKHRKAVSNMSAYINECKGQSPIRPELLTHHLSELADDNAIFTVDTGTPDIWSARFLQARKDRRIIGSFKHGSMACALAMALGAQAASPGRQVIALCGDGGLSMLPGDLITLVQYDLPVKIIVYNNDSLDFIRIEMQAAGLIPSEVDLHNPDFSQVAKSMGLYGERVDNCADMQSAIKRLFAHNGPALLDVVVSPNAIALPPTITLEQAKGFSLSLLKQALVGDFTEAWSTIKDNMKLRP